MARSLVIVESPAKAKTINRYLGEDYIVKSSVGHIRDLPVSGVSPDPKARAAEAAKTRKLSPEKRAIYKKERARRQLVKRMGIDPDDAWQADYQVLPGKEKIVDELVRIASKVDAIYLATDLDREGEAIAWHLREAIGGNSDRFHRVVFNEITRKAIEEAFDAPSQLDMDQVYAQQARRFLDRVVGFELSPLLWSKIARGLSAGRVQSVAVRLVVEKERAIISFIPEEFWEIQVDLQKNESLEVAQFLVVRDKEKRFRPGSKREADSVLERIHSGEFVVRSREDKPTQARPNAPFITSTLQQAASTRLGYSVKKTMTLAQRLYEGGYITYMRTDSTNLSDESIGFCREYILGQFGDKYLPDAANVYTSKEGAQEAHEAIRPTNVMVDEGTLSGIDEDGRRLYQLIWRQFIACQMVPAEYLSTNVIVVSGDLELRVRGRVMQFDGYTLVLPPLSSKDEQAVIPDYQISDVLKLVKAEGIQHFTKPPPRFGEASLVRELEKKGIGRPSTYASIISTIQERGYVSLKNKRFYAEKIGELVTDRLREKFEDLMDYSFTAEMEEKLDSIAEGNAGWREVLDSFYADFSSKLTIASGSKAGMRPNEPTDTNIDCPSCGRFLQVRTGSTGVFLGCSGYSLAPKERCKYTVNLIPGDEVVDVDKDEEGESKLLRSKRKCEKCSTLMTGYLVDENRKFHICGNNPDCDGSSIELGEFRIKGYDGPVIECDKCASDMELKTGRFGKYFGCSNDECNNTRKLLRNGEPAPPKADPIPMPELRCQKVDDHYLLRDGASGLFLAASQFPRNRETRAPLVAEIKVHGNELDAKFKYLLGAPEKDSEGRPAVIRYSRKLKEQYVQSEVEGKPSGWKASYRDGKWIEENKPKTRKKRARKSRK